MQPANMTQMREPMLLALFAALVVAPATCSGQIFGDPVSRQPYCDELPQPSALACRCAPPCRGNCTQPCAEAPPAKPREVDVPRPAPAPQPAMRETGYYQAGPRTGALEGASSTFGFRGGAITLPRLRLELPSLELPSFFRSSHTAKMRIAESEAPWTSTGFERVAWASEEPQQRSADAPPQPPEEPRARAAADEDCDALKTRYEQKIEELNRQILACEQLRKNMERAICEQRTPAPVQVLPQTAPDCPTPVCPTPICPVPTQPAPIYLGPGQPVPNTQVHSSTRPNIPNPVARHTMPQELPAPSPEPAEPPTTPVVLPPPPKADGAAVRLTPFVMPASHSEPAPVNVSKRPQRLPR